MSDIVLTEPTAYLYNGYRLPKLTYLDEYPYAIIFKDGTCTFDVYYCTTQITIGTASNGTYTLARGTSNRSGAYDSRKDTEWSSGSVYDSQSSYLSMLGTPIWSNHKITYPDGTSYIVASSQPSAIYEGNTEVEDSAIDLYSFTVGLTFGLADGLDLIDSNMYEYDEPVSKWELLYEGELTTSNELKNKNGYYVQIPFDVNTPLLSEAGESIRLTINGESKVYITVSEISLGTNVYIGNRWLRLFSGNVNIQDDGNDFYLYSYKAFGYEHGIYTRYSGTYMVKIERALFEPVAYLYNGHRLPALPKEWNQVEQPYCAIQISSNNPNIYYFYTASESFRPDSSYSDFEMVAPTCTSKLDITTGEGWEELQQRNQNRHLSVKNFIWTNCDIPYADGTIALKASDPVPVYE